MRVLLLIEKNMYLEKFADQISKLCVLKLCYLESGSLKSILNKNNFDIIILYTENITSRKLNYFKILKNYMKKKKSFFIEISSRKTKLETNKAISNAILQGFDILSWQFMKKIIQIKKNEIKE